MIIFHEDAERNIEGDLQSIKDKLFSIARGCRSDRLKFEFNLDKVKKSIKINVTEYDI